MPRGSRRNDKTNLEAVITETVASSIQIKPERESGGHCTLCGALPNDRTHKSPAHVWYHEHAVDYDDDAYIDGKTGKTRSRTYPITSEERHFSGRTYKFPELPPDSHSEDYRSVIVHGEQFNLTMRQAQIIEILWKASDEGHPEVHQQAILERIETGSRVRDSFRNAGNVIPAWNALVTRGKNRGTYRLNNGQSQSSVPPKKIPT